MTYFRNIESPIGRLLLTGTGKGLSGLYLHEREPAPDWIPDDSRLEEAASQLRRYFARELREFDLALDLDGTPFQLEVWNALRAIPYGETCSYGELARAIGRPAAVRAVGLANGRNPVSIVVPCHRVIGSNGSLTGYGGGLERKKYLLDLEAAVLFR
jgi:methylated-DNA-[protein]-cysteine S-methyltransferase